MIVFTKCCVCVPLRTGCFILGYLNLVSAVFWLAMSVGMMVMGIGFLDSPKEKEADAAAIVIGISAAAIVVFLFGVAFTIVFLVGLHKSKPKLIRMHITYCVVFLVIYFGTLLVRVFTVWNSSGLETLQTINPLVLGTYYILVIRSYYLKLINEQELAPEKNSKT